MNRLLQFVLLLALSPTIGCKTLGPRTVLRDRFAYQESLSRSRMEQLLINIVKVRYLEAPLFLDVGQIVAGYNLEGTLTGNAVIDLGSDGNIVGGSGSGRYVERPTITYSPISGRRFIELLFTPIPPSTIIFMVEAGYSADLILRLTVQSVNGIRNRTWRKDFEGDPEFFHVVEFLERMQRNDWVGMRVELGDLSKSLQTVLYFPQEELPDDVVTEIGAVLDTLGLDAGAGSYAVRYGPATGEPDVVNLHSRSMLQILLELSAGVEIPPEHLELGWTRAGLELDEGAPPPLMTVHSGPQAPESAYCSIQYRDNWFWIEDNDLLSKSVFAFILLIFNIAESGQGNVPPLVTIPAG